MAAAAPRDARTGAPGTQRGNVKSLIVILAATLAFAGAPFAGAADGKVEIEYLGHAAFKFISVAGKVIVIDPFLTQNPKGTERSKNLDTLGKVDLVLVTHGHGDHLGDGPEIAKRNNVPLYAPAGLSSSLVVLGVLPKELAPGMNKGTAVMPLPGIKLTMTHAEHSSEMTWKNPATGKDEIHVGGEPVGFVIEFENGFKVYHAGDTALFGDMRLIGELYKPDMAMLPIGGQYTMGPQEAALAVRDYLKPKFAVPIHYGTFPFLKGTPEEFEQALAGAPVKVMPMKNGDKASF
jgi:L-ascorbate metabolism protein UlaG (beta-lactamase superfamily)